MRLFSTLLLAFQVLVLSGFPLVIKQSNTDIRLKRGTPVTLKLAETINTNNLDKNHTVLLEVYLDVVVEGKIAISTGAYAEGYVSNYKARTLLGKGSELEIRAINAQCVDGQRAILIGADFSKAADKRKARFALGMLLGGLFLLVLGAILGAGGGIGVGLLGIIFFMSGLFMQGNDVEIPSGTILTATISEDITIKEL
jgi:hypothetical protein